MKSSYLLFSLTAILVACIKLKAQPVITSFTPASGPVGTAVTISGSKFNATPANNVVFFGAAKAAIVNASSNTLEVTVPPGTTYQPISVTDLTTNLTTYSTLPFLKTFSCGGYFNEQSFAAGIEFPSGSKPKNVALSDFDGDSKLDLAVTNTTSNTISLLRNNSTSGPPSFASPLGIATGTTPVSCAVSDLDGDGKPDLVVVNNASNNISVYLNKGSVGNIAFETKIDYETGASPQHAAIHDLDGDGKPDIAVVNRTGQTVSVLRNSCTAGTISFLPKKDFPIGMSAVQIAIADLNDDHKPDIAVAEGGGISILRNKSSYGFISLADEVYFGGNVASGIAIGDLDGDNKPDVVLSHASALSISLFRNTSTVDTILFAPTIERTLSYIPSSVSLTDIDGDAQPEILLTNMYGAEMSALGNTSTSGTISFSYSAVFKLKESSVCLALGDMDADGKPDIVSANNTANSISVLRNVINSGPYINMPDPSDICNGAALSLPLVSNIPSTFTWIAEDNPNTTGESTTLQTTSTLQNSITNNSDSIQVVKYTITPTSVDGNCPGTPHTLKVKVHPTPKMLSSDSEIVPDSGRVLIVLKSNTPCTYTWKAFDNPKVIGESITEETGYYISDTLTITSSPSSGELVTYTVTPTSTMLCGTGIPQTVTVKINIVPTITSFTPMSGPVGTVVTINGTHFNPVAANNIVFFGPVQAAVLTASETSLAVKVPLSSSYRFISVTDAITGLSASTSQPFIQTFNSCFGIYPTSFNTDQSVEIESGANLVHGDLNGDGKPELVMSNGTGSSVLVFPNISTGNTLSFASPQPFENSLGSPVQAIADLDGDGKLDLIGLNWILRNTSSGGSFSFAKKELYPGGTSITVGDVTKDGKPDIVVIHDNSYSGVCINKSTVGNLSFDLVGVASVDGYSTVALGDANNDGLLDLFVLTGKNSEFRVYVNRTKYGMAQFITGDKFLTGNDPYSIVTGDLDGDGKTDAITSSNYDGIISIHRNKTISTSSYVAFDRSNIDIGKNARSISIGDLDGDGKPDLAIAKTDSISLLRNVSTPGNIIFEQHVDFKASADSYFITANDLNGDTRTDLAQLSYSSKKISLYKNIMNTKPVMLSPTSDSIASGQKLDIRFKSTTPASYSWVASDNPNITGEHTTNQLSDTLNDVLKNNTPVLQTVTYTVTPTSALGCGPGPSQVITITVFQNAPSNVSFSPASGPAGTTVTITGTTFNTTASNNIVFFGTARAEVLSASTTKLVVTAPAGATLQPVSVTDALSHLTGYASRPFYLTFDCPEPFSTSSLAPKKNLWLGPHPYDRNLLYLGDIDGDGKLDLIATSTGTDTISVFRNKSTNGIIVFEPPIRLYSGGGSPDGVSIRDIDGDGKPDLAITSLNVMIDAGFVVFKNTSTIGSISFAPRMDYLLGGWHQRIEVEDLDNDGKPDLLTSNYRDGIVSIFKNKSTVGNILFAAPIDSLIGTSPFNVGIADLNGDLKPEVLFLDSDEDKVFVLRNNSTTGVLSFSPRIGFPTVDFPESMVTSDLDGDGKLDVITKKAWVSNYVFIHRNISSGATIAFDAAINLGSLPVIDPNRGILTVGDLDGDNKPDLILPGGMYVLKNTSSPGSISFAKEVNFLSGGNHVAMGDLDGDGKTDLVLGYNHTSDSVAIFRNNMCVVTELPETISGLQMEIYPNPFTAQTLLSFNNEVDHATVNIVDVFGKKVRTIQFSGTQLTIEKGELAAGIYFISVKNSDDLIAVKKIIIQY